MANFKYPLPDGTFVEAPVGTPTSAIEAWAKQKYPDAFRGTEEIKPERGGAVENFKKGVSGLYDAGRLGLGSLVDEQAARESNRKSQSEFADVKTRDFSDIEKAYKSKEGLSGLYEAVKQVPGVFGDNVAAMAPYMAATAAGAVAGQAAIPIPVVGGLIGALGANIPLMYGSNLQRQDQENPNQAFDKTAAAAAAVPQAALDAASSLFFLGKVFGLNKLGGIPLTELAKKSADVAEKKLVQEAKRSILGATARGAAQGVAVEMPTELAQQVLERAQAGLELLSPDALEEYKNVAGTTAIVGGGLGSFGGAAGRYRAKSELDLKDRAAADEATTQKNLAAEEERKKTAEFQKSDEYLVKLDADYNTYNDTRKSLIDQIRAIGKVEAGTTEAARKNALAQQLKQLTKENKALVEEYGAKEMAISASKEKARIAGMTPEEYMFEQLGVKPPSEQGASSIEDAANNTAAVTTPSISPVQQYAQDNVEAVLAPYAGIAVGGVEPDIVFALMRDPKLAQEIAANKTPLPGLNPQQSNAVYGGIKLQLKELEKAAKKDTAETLAQRQQDLITAANNSKQEKDPLALLKESMEEDRAQREQSQEEEQFLPEIQRAFNQASDGLKLPDGIRPIRNASSVLNNLNNLFDARDNAENPQAREQAQTTLAQLSDTSPLVSTIADSRREQSGLLGDATEFIEDLRVGRYFSNEGAGSGADIGTASSTKQGLLNKVQQLKTAYISAAIREAVATRAAFGKALTDQEALAAGRRISETFDEWLARAMALPRSAVAENKAFTPPVDPTRQQWTEADREAFVQEKMREALVAKIAKARIESIRAGNPTQKAAETTLGPDERRTIQAEARQEFDEAVKAQLPRAASYQLRGTEVVQSDPGKSASVDPRPPEERSLGKYRAATEAFKEQMRGIISGLTAVPDTGTRVEKPLIQVQFAQSEADKAAAARGETASSPERALARRREYVSNLIDRVMGVHRMLPNVKNALTRAKAALDEDAGSLDTISEEEYRFMPGLIDAAEELAQRVERRSLSQMDRQRLIGQIDGALQGTPEKSEQQPELFPELDDAPPAPTAKDTKRAESLLAGVKKSFEGFEKSKVTQAKKAQAQIDKIAERRSKRQEAFAKAVRKSLDLIRGKRKQAIAKKQKPLIDIAIKNVEALQAAREEARRGASFDGFTEFAQDVDVLIAEELTELNKARQDLIDEEQVAGGPVDIAEFLPIAQANKQFLLETKRLREAEAKLQAVQGPARGESQQAVKDQRAAVAAARQAQQRAKEAAVEQEQRNRRAQGLGLPGQRRVNGRLEPVKTETQLAAEKVEQARLSLQDAVAEARDRRQLLKTQQAILEEEIAEAEARVKELGGEFKQETDPRRKQELVKQFQEQRDKITVARQRIDALGETRPRRKGPAEATGSSSPRTLRGGTPESKAATNQLNKREQAAFDKRMAKSNAKQEARNADIETDSDTGGIGPEQDRFFGDALFRTGKGTAALTPSQSVAIINRFLANAPQSLRKIVKFYATQKDIPAKVMKILSDSGQVDADGRVLVKGGVLSSGDIFVLGEAHDSINDLHETLAHEITGHYGLRQLLGEEGIRQLAAKFSLKELEDVAAKLGVPEAITEADSVSTARGETEAAQGRRRIDEILGYLEEKRVSETALGKVRRFVGELMGLINAALRQLGLRSPYSTSANDLRYILARARRAAFAEDAAPAKESDTTVFRAAKVTHANPDIERAVGAAIGRDKSVMDKIRETATGLRFRTAFVDSNSALQRALATADPAQAIQVQYDLMMHRQKNQILAQAMTSGTPDRTWWGKEKGRDVYKTEVVDGASMRGVAEKLLKVKKYGNEQATSDVFTLLAMGKRAQTEGWDRVFADDKQDSAEIVAEKQHARDTATALAKELDDGDSPFKEAYEEYQDWNKGMLQFAQKAGVISEDEFRRLAGKRNYTPLIRADSKGNMVLEIDAGRTITLGSIKDEARLQELKGGSGKIMDFFTASAYNASALIEASLQNLASREAVFALHSVGAATRVNNTAKGDNIITFRKDGEKEPQRWEINTDALGIPTDLVVKGFAGVPVSLPTWVRMMGVPANLLRKAVTRNPVFMAKSLARDPVAAWLATGADFNPITDTFKELRKAFAGTEDKTLERRGITGGALFSNDEADFERIKKGAESAQPWSVGYWTAKLDDMAHAADSITRRNVYNGAIKQGASEIRATLAAWESMPFSKSGTSTSVRYLTHMVPFLSAAIQGWDVMYRALKNDMPLADRVNIRNALVARGMLIGGMTMLYALGVQGGDEDDPDSLTSKYNKASTYERLNNWFLPIPGTNQVIKVPTPFEFGIVFKMIPEAMVRTSMGNGTGAQNAKEIGKAVLNMVPNIVLPQAIIPMVEAATNYSLFSDAPIENKTLQGIDIGKRADSKTSELSKLLGFDTTVLGAQMGLSPKMLDYVLGQYTGGLYTAFAGLVDNILPAPTAAKPDRKLAELPVFRSIMLQDDSGGEKARLYDSIDKFTKSLDTMKWMALNEPENLQKYVDENKENIGKGKLAESAQKALGNINKNMQAILRDPNMTSEQKQQAVTRLRAMESAMARRLNQALAA